jgi:hypothetical protein
MKHQYNNAILYFNGVILILYRKIVLIKWEWFRSFFLCLHFINDQFARKNRNEMAFVDN